MGIGDHQLTALLEQSALAVGQVVADQAGALHAIRLETVARLHRTEGQGEADLTGIERGTMRVTADGNLIGGLCTELPTIREAVEAGLRDTHRGKGLTTLLNDKLVTVDEQFVGGRLEYTARGTLQGIKHLLDLRRSEAVRGQQLKEEALGRRLCQRKEEHISETDQRMAEATSYFRQSE